ncbi:transcriptional regulator GutM [Zophobihabitans entericus]|uniref:Transcriptional regulator n=1 Tax=Zophobihabitans entericus TaxID=1635327 RepID=A0A6G9IAU5_9GAMM|nr:transcriptional regulator GutM [Zophobihabitans entericus]QIQ20700.1 transcriptional regulator [Zophobihabitans entericus]
MNLVLIACTIFVAQSVLSFMQVRYYQKHMHKIAQQYTGKSGHHLYSSMERKRFGSSAIALLVINDDKVIQECQIMQGKSIFAKFRDLPNFKNQNLSQMLSHFAGEEAIRKLSISERAIIKTANSVKF